MSRARAAGADLRDAAATVTAGTTARPVHVLLFAAVAGLVCGPRLPWLGGAGAGACLLAAAGLRWWPGARRATAGAGSAPERETNEPRGDGPEPDPAGPSADDDLADALRRSRRRQLAAVLVVAAVAGLAGTGVGAVRAAALAHTELGDAFGTVTGERVELVQAPRASPFGGWSALARLRGEPVLLRDRAGLQPAPGVGAVLAVDGSLRPPGDYARARRLHAELTARSLTVVAHRGGLAGAIDGVRRRAEAALDRGLPAPAAALFRGMVLGQDDAFDEPTREAFRASGLSHLVAASGTNVVLLAGLAMGVGIALGLGLTGRLWLVLGLIVLYVPLAGGGASIQRAGIMGAAAVAAGLVGRPSSRWYGLALAGVLTLVLDPRAVEDPGWQLSFVAVLSLLLLAPGWRDRLLAAGLPRALAEVTAMTGAATVATAPVLAAHFGEASLVALPANLLAAPAVAPIMWLGVVAAAVGQAAGAGGPIGLVVGAVADGFGALAGFPLGYLGWVARTAAAAPNAVVEIGPGPVAAVAAAAVAVASSGRVRRALPVACVVATAAWLALGPRPLPVPPPAAGLRVTFLDVGQGDATLLEHGSRSVLVDTGPPDTGLVERLRGAGVRRLDLLVATHAQLDHIGAAGAVLRAFEVGAVLDGRDGVREASGDALAAAAAEHGTPLVPGRRGQALRLGRLRLDVLWPPARTTAPVAGEDPNDRAIVLRADVGGARALLPADAESDVLSRLDVGRVDLLKVAHHGSDDPGLPALLRTLRPQVAGIGVGADNTYGHPTPSTLAALAAVPAVVRTDRDGSVRVERGPDGRTWELRQAR